MNNQPYLKSLCLLGTDRQPVDAAKLSGPIASLIQELKELEPAEQVLHALSLDHYYRLAASKLPQLEEAIESVSITESAPHAPNAYYPVLHKILDID
ncbi:MAG: hypothetical protein AAFV07_09470, partial [Bacteroidota bacterium]